MTIQKEFVYKCKGYCKDYEYLFEYVDDNRKVDINTTGAFICKIKKWLNFFSKNKSKYLQDWNNYFKYHLIADGINPHIDEGQYYVKQNYQLLKSNKTLTYNQALFLLLGLNAHELERGIKDFPVLDGDEPIAKPFELEFWRTKQNQELKQSSFIVDGKITSENLKELADDNGFFIKLKSTNLKTAQNDKNKEIIQNVLLEFLSQSTPSTKHNVNALSQKSKLKGLLKNSGIIVTEIDEEINKNDRKPNELTPRTLATHLTEIFTSDWWTKQDKTIQSKVKNYQ